MTQDNTNKYITVAYKLFTYAESEQPELQEEATVEIPFQFISGLGMTLDAFEAQIVSLEAGDTFDFTLNTEEGYGEYDEAGCQAVPRSIFEINGKLDNRYIYEGAIVPLTNAEGGRFNGLIVEIGEDTITVDLNHPLAGKNLNFAGKVVQSRPATNEEIQDALKSMTGEGGCCGCGGGDCGDGGCEGGDCGGGCGGGCSCGN